MIIKKYILLLFSIIFLQNVSGQLVFNKTDNLENDIEYKRIISIKNGEGYLIIGRKNNDDYTNFFMSKLNYTGDTIWTRIEGIGSYSNIIESEDGNFVLSGLKGDASGMESNSSLFQCKIDSKNGAIIWENSFDEFGIGYSSFFDMKSTNDHGFILCGTETVNNLIIEDLEPLGIIVKTDKNGLIQWFKQYHDSINNSLICFSIVETQNQEYLVTRSDQKLLKLNTLGDTIWSKSIPIQNAKLVKLIDNNFVLIGQKHVSSDTTLAVCRKINANGDLIWEKTFKESYNYTQISELKQNTNGNLVFIENTSNIYLNPNKFFKTYFKEIDQANGDLILEKSYVYAIADTSFNRLYSFDLSPDGGFIMAGNFSYYQNNSWKNGDWIVKTDCQGNDSFWDEKACSLSSNFDLELSLFPNPTTGEFTCYTLNEDILDLTIHNALGEEVFHSTPLNKLETINLSSQAAGIYTCRVRTESNQLIVRKIALVK